MILIPNNVNIRFQLLDTMKNCFKFQTDIAMCLFQPKPFGHGLSGLVS